MQPDIRIFPKRSLLLQSDFLLFKCYSCIWKTKIGKYTKIVFNTEFIKSSLPRWGQLRFPGNCPPIASLSHILP